MRGMVISNIIFITAPLVSGPQQLLHVRHGPINGEPEVEQRPVRISPLHRRYPLRPRLSLEAEVTFHLGILGIYRGSSSRAFQAPLVIPLLVVVDSCRLRSGALRWWWMDQTGRLFPRELR
jgi:hypothetical protein